MPRSALILSCTIHGSVLALVGWSSLWVAPRLDHSKAGMSVSLSPGERALVSEDVPAPHAPDIAAAPAETFTPPAPTIEPTPWPVAIVEAAPPAIPSVADVPRKMPALAPAKKERAPRTASSSSRRGAARGTASGMSMGGGGGGSGYVPPQFLLRHKPMYPEQARAQHLEGVVMLLVSVDEEGHVTSASLRQGCGYAVLDRAALEAVRTWRFSPGRQGGRAIPATVEIPIRFNFAS